ncbi:hypothetical protein [Actinomadura sp. 6N118]|uniref:hypothetical protein n=1 Tax=Actinomadura sp. 6N118 TaxID=3375151 RepID=UPI0037B5AA1D
MTGNELRLPTPGDEAPPLVLRCEHRADDEGRLWFTTGNGEPLAPADAQHLHEAITAVKGRVAPTKAVGM